jgi:hypothetical protein
LFKKTISFLLIFTISLCMFSLSIFASTITQSYDGGNITFNGSGFIPNTNYTIRLVRQTPQEMVFMTTVTSDDNGNINQTAVVGILEDGAYNVFVNRADGTPGVSSTSVVQVGNTGGGNDGGTGNGGGTGGGTGSGSGTGGGTTTTPPTQPPTQPPTESPTQLPTELPTQPPTQPTITPIDESNNNENEEFDDGGFIGNPFDDTGSSGHINNQDFGRVPQTGLPDITWAIIAMLFSFSTLIVLIVFSLHLIKKRINYGRA